MTHTFAQGAPGGTGWSLPAGYGIGMTAIDRRVQ